MASKTDYATPNDEQWSAIRSTDDHVLVAASAGKTKIPIAGVKSPKTKVPASGGFTVTSTGKAASFKIKKVGTYTVKIPTKFLFSITQYTDAQPDGSPLLTNASCAADKGTPTKLGTLKVVK